MQPVDWLVALLAAAAVLVAVVHASRSKRQLARAKQKYAQLLTLKAQEASRPSARAEPPTQVVPATPPPPPPPVIHEIQFCGAAQATPIARLRRASEDLWTSAKRLPMSRRRLSNMAGMVEHAPTLALSAATASQDVYAVTFTDATALRMAVGDAGMQHASGGGLRAIAVDSSTGKILEHGRLGDVSWLNVAGFATAAWTVLTVLVGKKYLADISSRLDAISTDVQSIKSILENEMEGWLHGMVITLKRHLRELQDEAVGPSYAQALLSDCLQISREARHRWNSLSLSYGDAIAGLEQLTSSPIMSEDAVLRSAAAIRVLHARAAALDVATQIRAGCEHLRSSLGLSTAEGADELHRLATAIEEIRELEAPLQQKLNTMLACGERPVLFGREKFDQAQRHGLESVKAFASAEFTGHRYCETVAKHVRSGFLTGRPITILLRRTESGEVAEARMVSDSAR